MDADSHDTVRRSWRPAFDLSQTRDVPKDLKPDPRGPLGRLFSSLQAPPSRGKRAVASRSSRSMWLRTYWREAPRNGCVPGAVWPLARAANQPAAALAFALACRARRDPTALRPRCETRRSCRRAEANPPDCRARPIAPDVIELVGIVRRMDELERPAPDHHQRRNGALGEIFAERLVVAGAPGEMRPETPPVDREPERPRIAGGKINERRQQIDERHAGGNAGGARSGRG
jgi:hypothetical protein